jgi:nucleotide-binding universal stress UspA family protein
MEVRLRAEVHSPDQRGHTNGRVRPTDGSNRDRNDQTHLRVLVATEGSAESLAAIKFAAGWIPADAEVRLLVIVSYSSGVWPVTDGGTRTRLRRAVDVAARPAREILDRAGLSTSVRYRFGNAAEEILAEVEEWEPRLLVMGRRKRRGLTRLIDASVSSRVLRRTQVPVLVAGSTVKP